MNEQYNARSKNAPKPKLLSNIKHRKVQWPINFCQDEVISQLTTNLHFMIMKSLRISLVLLVFVQASSFVEGNCDTFSLGDCANIDSIFYENDKVEYLQNAGINL